MGAIGLNIPTAKPTTFRPHIAVTAGEPAGIGPDLCLQLASFSAIAQISVISDPHVLRQRAKALGMNIDIKLAGETPQEKAPPRTNLDQPQLSVIPVTTANPVIAGKLDSANAACVLESLNIAADGCQTGRFSAMVTAPVQKSVIADAGYSFSGHTEYLAERCAAPLPVMMLTAPGLRVALVTTHLPLRDVADAITPTLLMQTLEILHHDLEKNFGIANPRILVCGLNPHAGEGGHLGREEIEVIEPVLQKARGQGINAIGPLPADTLFTPKYLQNCDAVLSMFHDQGLPVLKHMGFGESVNVTLGLPIIRTSVDHGTALDLAGSGKADASSLIAALRLAISLATAKNAAQTIAQTMARTMAASEQTE